MKTQILTMRDQIARKTNRIEEIKSTLKQSQLMLMKNTESGTSGFGVPSAPDQTSSQTGKEEQQTPGGSTSTATDNHRREEQMANAVDLDVQK